MFISKSCLLISVILLYKVTQRSLFVSATKETSSHDSPEADKLFEDFWNWSLKTFPEIATWIGVHNYDAELTDLSMTALQEQLSKTEEFKKRATELRSEVTCPMKKSDLDELIYVTQSFIDGFKYEGFLTPINNVNGIQKSFLELIKHMRSGSSENTEVIKQRMQKFPNQITQTVNLMKRGMEKGITNHLVSMGNIGTQIEELIVLNEEESPFYKTIPDISLSIGTVIGIDISISNLIKGIVDALLELKNFIFNDYNTRSNISISSTPLGSELYDAHIKYYVPEMTSAEIHEIEHEATHHILDHMKELMEEMGSKNNTLKSFSNIVNALSENFFASPEEVVQAFQDVVSHRIIPKLSKYFNNVQDMDVRVYVDTNVDLTSYQGLLIDPGLTNSTFKIIISNFKNWTKYELPTFALENIVPGNYLYMSSWMGKRKYPQFRKCFGCFSNSLFVPSTFPSYEIIKKGWASYAEALGMESGIYETPLEKFAHYLNSLLQSSLAVVDTGIHSMGWSREKATKFLENHLQLDSNYIQAQVDQCITSPGSVLPPSMGKYKLIKWRNNAQKKLGSDFDIKEFHDIILKNPTNIKSMELKIQDWMAMKIKNREEEKSVPPKKTKSGPPKKTKSGPPKKTQTNSSSNTHNSYSWLLIVSYICLAMNIRDA